jgi:hypothetical protein
MKPIPFAFVLDELHALSPRTTPMFGCTAVYVGTTIVFVLRDRLDHPEDNGVWMATTVEHHESLRNEFPSMRSISVLGGSVTGWQMLPSASEDFEHSVTRACELVLQKDLRIGKPAGAGGRDR